MNYELLYTSAPSGLRPGSSGYCTVKSSRGIPAPTVSLLESLSGYRHVYPAGSPEAKNNPVNFGHYTLRISGRREHVLSRVSDCELDYTGRSNKIGHHMVVENVDQVPAGPAWVLRQQGWMIERWDGNVGYFEQSRTPSSQSRSPGKCPLWARVSGDSGWAGVLAESFLSNPARKVFVIYQPGTDLLGLFEEAISLLPENRRWDVTFATYGVALPATVECLWNGVVAGSQEVMTTQRFVGSLRVDLTSQLPQATGGNLVELARTGKATSPSKPTLPTPATAETATPQTAEQAPQLAAPTRPQGPSAPPPVPRRKTPTSNVPFIAGIATVCLLLAVGTFFAAAHFLQDSSIEVEASVAEVEHDTSPPSDPPPNPESVESDIIEPDSSAQNQVDDPKGMDSNTSENDQPKAKAPEEKSRPDPAPESKEKKEAKPKIEWTDTPKFVYLNPDGVKVGIEKELPFSPKEIGKVVNAEKIELYVPDAAAKFKVKPEMPSPGSPEFHITSDGFPQYVIKVRCSGRELESISLKVDANGIERLWRGTVLRVRTPKQPVCVILGGPPVNVPSLSMISSRLTFELPDEVSVDRGSPLIPAGTIEILDDQGRRCSFQAGADKSRFSAMDKPKDFLISGIELSRDTEFRIMQVNSAGIKQRLKKLEAAAEKAEVEKNKNFHLPDVAKLKDKWSLTEEDVKVAWCSYDPSVVDPDRLNRALSNYRAELRKGFERDQPKVPQEQEGNRQKKIDEETDNKFKPHAEKCRAYYETAWAVSHFEESLKKYRLTNATWAYRVTSKGAASSTLDVPILYVRDNQPNF